MSRTHGLASAYRSGGCRCEDCRRANTARTRDERVSRATRLRADPTLRPHGNIYTYTNWSCRCEYCVQAWTQHQSEKRRTSGVPQ